MKKLLLCFILGVVICGMGCYTPREPTPCHVELFENGLIREWDATDYPHNVVNRRHAPFIQFRCNDTGKIIVVSGTVIITEN